MLKTLESLQDRVIKSYEILDFKSGESFYFLKVKAVIIDDSELHIKEYYSVDSYFYSYHWQDRNGFMKIRWDNAPHHRHLGTFPDHKHDPVLAESGEMSLKDVLKEIKAKLENKDIRYEDKI
jgi:hypothetical protein